MANASIIHSAICLALVGCYDPPPDIQLQVSRKATSTVTDVGISACDEQFACSTEKDPFGGSSDNSTKIAIYVNDDRQVVVVRLRIVGAPQPRLCYHVTLTNSMLVRLVNVDGPTYWDCPIGTANCEQNGPCL